MRLYSSINGERMKSEQHIPSDLLKPFIKTFLIIESETGSKNLILPDTSMVMAFRIKGSVRFHAENKTELLPSSVITGLRRSSRTMDYAPGTATLLVIFTEGGVASFFKEPLHELFNRSLSIDHFVDRQQTQDVEDRLATAKNNRQRIIGVEQFLLSRLKSPSPDKPLVHAVQQIRRMNGQLNMKALANDVNMSQDAFEKRFRRKIGTSPKQFSSIVRLRHIITHYSADRSFTNMAYDAGYFDQSHFTKDFRSFTGRTPNEFFKSAVYW